MNLIAVLSAVLVASVLANLRPGLVDAETLARKRVYDTIPTRTHERVLVGDQGYPVSGLAMVLNVSIETLSRKLEPGTTWFGGAEIERTGAAVFTSPTRGYASSSDAALATLREEMENEGMKVARVSEWQISFKPYNLRAEDAEKSAADP